MIHNDVHEKLVNMAAERGWNEETQIIHLCGFLQEIHDDGDGILLDWESYLANAAEDEDKETENANQYAQSLEEADFGDEMGRSRGCPDEMG